MSHRVVVTGLGVVAPNGLGVPAFEAALHDGVSGVAHVPELAERGFACQVAAIPKGVDERAAEQLIGDDAHAHTPKRSADSPLP